MDHSGTGFAMSSPMTHGQRPTSSQEYQRPIGVAESRTRRHLMRAVLGAGLMPGPVAPVDLITVSSPGNLTCGDLRSVCAIGRGGIRIDKREGDGATPAGRFPLRRVLFRQDRIPSIESRLPVEGISKRDGWCTDPRSAAYNQRIALPHDGPHEKLWRDDGLYDVIVVIGCNDAPVVAGKGSAIFLHVARPAMSATDGCVAVAIDVILEVVRRCNANTLIEIRP
jgi:L,D-peptidoglycan transpeptidase YkuD (ErfK/YbiS/YcfS/YnhG family)